MASSGFSSQGKACRKSQDWLNWSRTLFNISGICPVASPWPRLSRWLGRSNCLILFSHSGCSFKNPVTHAPTRSPVSSAKPAGAGFAEAFIGDAGKDCFGASKVWTTSSSAGVVSAGMMAFGWLGVFPGDSFIGGACGRASGCGLATD